MKSIDKVVLRYSIINASKFLGVGQHIIIKLREYAYSGRDESEVNKKPLTDLKDIKSIESELFRLIEEDPSNPMINELQYKYVHYGM